MAHINKQNRQKSEPFRAYVLAGRDPKKQNYVLAEDYYGKHVCYSGCRGKGTQKCRGSGRRQMLSEGVWADQAMT